MSASVTPRGVAVAAGLGLLAAGLAGVPAAVANPAGTGLVISEAYLNGGSANAVYTHKYVELHNPTDAPIDLSGLSLQYRSATNNTNNASGSCVLSGTVDPGDHFVVQGASNGSNGVALPTSDLTCSSPNVGGAGGQIFVVEGTSAINPGGPGSIDAGAVVDFVGYGTAGSHEGTGAAPAASVSTSIQRTNEVLDTDDNAVDFTAATPTPGQPATTTQPPTEPEPQVLSIAEIQGTGPATTVPADQTVVTQGVVTALLPDPYPNELSTYGGLDGMFIQSGGSGGVTDATPGASDAIFVYFGNTAPAGVEVGDSVEVTGTAGEFNGMTQISVTGGGVVAELDTALAPVAPRAIAYPTTDEARERHEGELLAPTDTFTVTNVYATNQYGEVGLATGTTPLRQPTDVARPGTPEADAVAADNAARGVILDDGTSINYLSNGSAQQDLPLPWLTPDNPIRVGARATLESPVVLDFRNDAWKLQPSTPVTDAGADVATFENTRPENAQPQEVGGDLTLATFNVLNYFNTTAEDFVANGGTCTVYRDRDDNPVGANRCTPDGPRGAAEADDLARQEAKIVAAINTMDADVVALEEIENSVKLLTETDRDDAVKSLVAALNEDAGTERWAFVESPPADALPPLAEQDVIRNAFIYNPSTVELVGASQVLVGEADFSNAREPLAQAFKPVGGLDDQAFAVVVNHFKSKSGDDTVTGDNVDTGDGQGAYNGDRVRQARALAVFAEQFAASRGTDKVFLTGDLNAYTFEDPMQELYDAGYAVVESGTPDEWTYSFSGLSGSLDHVLANEAAREMVTGADIWEINANESIAFQYSRHNYNITQFHADDVFAASDHNPTLVGLKTPTVEPGAPTVKAKVTPQRVVVNRTRAKVHVRVLQEGTRVRGGTLDVLLDGRVLATGVLRNGGVGQVRLPVFRTTGTKALTVRWSAEGRSAESTVTVRVLPKPGKGKPGKPDKPGKPGKPGKDKPGKPGKDKPGKPGKQPPGKQGRR